MTYQDKLSALRKTMEIAGIHAYVITASDPHMSEYVPDRYKCIQFMSGFSGSIGTLVVTPDFAGLWADFRYFEQAEVQLLGSGYELVKLRVQHTPEYIEWLYEILSEGAVVAFDFRSMSVILADQMKEGLSFKDIILQDADLITRLWEDRPALPAEKAFLLDEAQCGQTYTQKIAAVRERMKLQKANAMILTALDDQAWLFNIRGADVRFNPVVLCYTVITLESVSFFIAPDKLTVDDSNVFLQRNISVINYSEFEQHLQALQDQKAVLLDPKRTNYQIKELIPAGPRIILAENPVVLLKSIKNNVEIENFRLSMIKDGVALTKFFKWLEDNLGHERITEMTTSRKVSELRAAMDGFAGISFAPIAGYAANAAMPHYSPNEDNDTELLSEGVFLLDSGGHYFFGTTDITRTIPLGETTEQEKMDYTVVLSAMIAGSMAIFPVGTRGYQLDSLCRQPLWKVGINYGHGTGHGVGYFLNVHEGPQNIGPSNAPVALEKGMITSIEPGIYRPEKHGIRIENLVLTIDGESTEFGDFLKFETLTLCYIDTSMVLLSLLSEEQIGWLNSYNAMVYSTLVSHLNGDEATWLADKCMAL